MQCSTLHASARLPQRPSTQLKKARSRISKHDEETKKTVCRPTEAKTAFLEKGMPHAAQPKKATTQRDRGTALALARTNERGETPLIDIEPRCQKSTPASQQQPFP